MLYMLTGFTPLYEERFFTLGEANTAKAIAKEWEGQGNEPKLYLKSYNCIKPVQVHELRKAA